MTRIDMGARAVVRRIGQPFAAAGCLALALGLTGCTSGGSSAAGAANDSTIAMPGLDAPVRIVTDRWGIPHVRATSLADLYLAWGFVTARDRLWGLAQSRQAARGELWRWFGNRALTADGGAQLFELRTRAAHIWSREAEKPDVRLALDRYAQGVNAYMDQCRSGAREWPVEFTQLGVRPDPWLPEDALLILLAQGFVLDFALPELDEAQAIREHGMRWLEARRRFEQDWMFTTIPDSAAARMYGRRNRPVLPGAPFPSGTRSGAWRPEAPGATTTVPATLLADARCALAPWLAAASDPEARASNVFAIGGGRTRSGIPILANDPHLALASPSVLHVIHLTVPGVVDALGAAVVGLPAIVSGRNAACAWGITALGADVMDVYADSLSQDLHKVRGPAGWVPLREADFTMRYRALGFLPLPTLGQKRRYTPHGPVVAFDAKRRLALAVRWAGNDSAVTLSRLIGLERSGSAAEAAERWRTLVTPTMNMVAADRAGHVVYQTAGAVPRRGFEMPLGLLPDDGRHEWQGLIAPEEMPHWDAPARGFAVNANNLPIDTPYPEPLPRYDWMHDRAARMAQLLSASAPIGPDEARAIQNDVFSRGAERFVPRLLACADSLAATLTPAQRAALDMLRRWDDRAARSRVAPTMFRAWLAELQRRSRLEGLGGLTAAALDGRAPEALRVPGAEAPERAAVAATEALKSALTALALRLGPDPATWTWARAHRARFRNTLGWRDSTLQPDPTAADGDNSTVSVGRSSLPVSTSFTHGPVWRHVVDLAVADSSWGVLPPGNAAEGPHARDLLARWANHEYIPLYLNWDRVEQARESAVTLVPGGTRR